MKIVAWIGNEANQIALVNKIHSQFPLAGVITETRVVRRKITIKSVAEKIFEKIFLPVIGKSWWGMKKYYEEHFSILPDTAILNVESINSDAAFDFTNQLQPDLIIVSGTGLIKEKMLSIKAGILNLHTGLSPYIKGGPNCTNWCIAMNQFHLIGNTIMWIDAGIDSGNIIVSELTDFDGSEDLPAIHIKVMEHAHDLYLRAIASVMSGDRPGLAQTAIAFGKTYYSKDWNLKQKKNLVRNVEVFKRMVTTYEYEKLRKSVVVIRLPG